MVAPVPVAVEEDLELEAAVPGVALVDTVTAVVEDAAAVAVIVVVELVSPEFAPPTVMVVETTVVLPFSISVVTIVVVAATAAGPAYLVQNPSASLFCAVRIE